MKIKLENKNSLMLKKMKFIKLKLAGYVLNMFSYYRKFKYTIHCTNCFMNDFIRK